ncbi:hypothetical protein Lysil_1598 [Lysobacter silvestris]|uniref:Porin n=1 Tax=Solilutibacter silvestris TaxID=1645665 RepID=A0A2K1PX98_9GAMM|nr:hypothetical protein Lysil_1598 [Lysobacter silvestris]
MNNRFRTAVAVSLLAIACSGSAYAQSSALVPIVNNKSGKVEAFLRLDPIAVGGKRAQWRFGSSSLESAFGLGSGESLALLCDSGTTEQSIRNLSSSCMLGTLGGNNRHGVGASVQKGGNHLGFNIGKGNTGLPEWLTPAGGKVQQTDMALFAERTIGRNGVVSIAGTTANARLVPATEMQVLADHWNTQSLSLGGGVGNIRANIFGRVVNVPGQPKFEGFGLGVTWRTPWSGQLSVGAENIVTKGSNPFAVPNKDGKEDSAVPYVRYQQDL